MGENLDFPQAAAKQPRPEANLGAIIAAAQAAQAAHQAGRKGEVQGAVGPLVLLFCREGLDLT